MVIAEVIGVIAALKPAMVELEEDAPFKAPLRLTSAKVFVPANVCDAVVTTPPLVPSAAVSVIEVPLIVAPFTLEVALIEPTVETPEAGAACDTHVVPLDTKTLPVVPGATV